MGTYVNEQTVMQYYIDLIDNDKIVFLHDKPSEAASIKELTTQLMNATNMNEKIMVACSLWKILFENAMSFISPNKNGYDKLFKYFDAYVEFEELIFASDSFYRDHTLHCIWVYFLGEYIKRNEKFSSLFIDSMQLPLILEALSDINTKFGLFSEKVGRKLNHICSLVNKSLSLNDAAFCVESLTHDLGYPIKKIEKINKSIKKVLPFFAINNFTDFSFEYNNIQQEFITNFIDLLSREMNMNISTDSMSYSEAETFNNLFGKVFISDKYGQAKSINREALEAINPKDVEPFRGKIDIESGFVSQLSQKQACLNDFENYQHGIMSAFLLEKNLGAFQDIDYNKKDDLLESISHQSPERILILQQILESISWHTCDSMKISEISDTNYLTFVDELEEFSRISRASQNREYVKEFCETYLDMDEDGWFNIDFVFSNSNLDNLNPEISFKGRCKRFLKLFDIQMMSPHLKLRVKCIDKLASVENVYLLEIANNHTLIKVNDEEKNVQQYLKSAEY